jgi:site-specific recombinase XerD
MIGTFIRFLENSDRTPTLAEFNIENVRDFLVSEQIRGLSPYTIQARVLSLKGFSSWLLHEGYSLDNLLANLRLPKAPTKVIEPLTTEEIESLVAQQDPLIAIGSRNLAILMALIGTGTRVSELSNTRYEDSHIEEGYLKA